FRNILSFSLFVFQNGWQPRRKGEGPKTLDQVHREAANEKLLEQQMLFEHEERKKQEQQHDGKRGGGGGGRWDAQSKEIFQIFFHYLNLISIQIVKRTIIEVERMIGGSNKIDNLDVKVAVAVDSNYLSKFKLIIRKPKRLLCLKYGF